MRDPGVRSDREAELKVGLLVLAAVAAVISGVAWLTGADLGEQRYTLFAWSDEAGQTSSGARVYLRGVDVGSVQGVQLVGDRVLLRMRVSSRVSLPTDSRAVIEPSGFLGSQMVRLIPGARGEVLAERDTVRASTTPDLMAVLGDLGDQAQEVLGRTARVLSDSTVRALGSGASDLAVTLEEIRDLVESERRSISRLVRRLGDASDQLARATAGPELRRTVTQLDSLTRRLSATSEELDASSRSLASILGKVDAGEGSLGRLVNDERLYERVTAAVENLQAATEELALLAKDVRERPDRYLNELKIGVF